MSEEHAVENDAAEHRGRILALRQVEATLMSGNVLGLADSWALTKVREILAATEATRPIPPEVGAS